MRHATPVLRGLTWLIGVMWDVVKGLCLLRFIGPSVTVFGSARLTASASAYPTALQVGRALGAAGFTIVTGGGPGLMEAANRGARDAGACSAACRMRFSFEQLPNAYVNRCVTFRYFFVRKVMMCRYSLAFVVLPGGLGTLDELFEVLALIQTNKMRTVPVVLVGRSYWHPLLGLLQSMVAAGTIAAADLNLLRVTDDVDDVVGWLRAAGLDSPQPVNRPTGAPLPAGETRRPLAALTQHHG